MAIQQGSRYEGDKVCRVRTIEGRQPSLFTIIYEDTTAPCRFHVVTQGERMDVIAYHQYGDPRDWWRIMAANPELDVPDPLEPGTVLKVPL